MDLIITIDDTGAPDVVRQLGSLEDWLLRDDSLREIDVSRPAGTPGPGEQGALADVLVVALGSGGAGAALVGTLTVWLRQQTAEVRLKLRTGRGEVEVSGTNLKDPQSLVREVGRLLDEDEDDADGSGPAA